MNEIWKVPGVKVWGLFVPWLLLLLFGTATAGPARADVNVIKSIKSVTSVPDAQRGTVAGVEIEVTSTHAFPVGDEIVVLRIGGREFSLSHSPSDGSLNTLFFSLTGTDFDALRTGEPVLVYYGSYDPKNEVWNFGNLNKGLLNQTK